MTDAPKSLTARLIFEEARRRGWQASIAYEGSSLMRFTRDDGVEIVSYSSTPPTTSSVAAWTADNKYATTLLYKAAGLPVPETRVINEDLGKSATSALDFVRQRLSAGLKLVVKPLDAGHGNGITVGIDSETGYMAAVKVAQGFSSTCVVQDFVPDAVDVRFTCIDYTCVGVVARLPARVKGDGQHTIQYLLDLENNSERRGDNYEKTLNNIPSDLANKYLGERMGEVPLDGDYVQVVGTANVGTGGETVEIFDDVPEWLKQMAEKAAKVSSLACCGVDFLLEGWPKPTDTEATLRPVIIEINKCPSLFLHDMPTHGPSRPVVKDYVDYLARI
jgi:cyanophycin synthetase